MKLAVLILAGAWMLGSSADEVRPSRDDESQAREKVVATGNGRRVRISAGTAEADTSPVLVLRDEQGRTLITLQLFENGGMGYYFGADPRGMSGFCSPDGRVGFNVAAGRGRCSLLKQADERVVVETMSDRGVLREFVFEPRGVLVGETPPRGVAEGAHGLRRLVASGVLRAARRWPVFRTILFFRSPPVFIPRGGKAGGADSSVRTTRRGL